MQSEQPAWPPQPQLPPDQPSDWQDAPQEQPAPQPPEQPHRNGTKHPLQREPAGPRPADKQPAQRPWELLTEAEQFAILYPERVAAGATSHEDAHLWLSNPVPPPAARAAR